MSFFSDLGDFGHALFSGRWTGGENSVGDVVQRDPWVLAAPAALAAAPFAAPLLGELTGLGAAEGALGGAGEAFGGLAGGGIDAAAAGGASLDDLALANATGGTSAFVGPTQGLTADTFVGATQSMLGSDVGATGFGAGGGTATNAAASGGGANWLDTLTSPSKWTLGGMAQAGGAALAGGGLLANLHKGSASSAAQNQVTNTAGAERQQFQELTAEAKQLRSYLENGTLPPGQQAAIDQAVQAEKARMIANAGRNGVSTDPTQNTALSQDLAKADRNGLILAYEAEQQLFQSGQSLLNSGLNALGLSGQLYTTLANMDRSDTANLNQAIANFAAALGGGRGTTINLGGGGSNRAAA